LVARRTLVDHGWPATAPQKTVCPLVVLDSVPVLVPEVVAPEVVVAEPVANPADALVVPMAAAGVVASPPLEPPQATMTGASAKSPAARAIAGVREDRCGVMRATIPARAGSPAPAASDGGLDVRTVRVERSGSVRAGWLPLVDPEGNGRGAPAHDSRPGRCRMTTAIGTSQTDGMRT